jgi:hypothetical protein
VSPAQCLIAAKNSTPARFRKHFFNSIGAQMPFFSVFAQPGSHRRDVPARIGRVPAVCAALLRGFDFRCAVTAKRVFRNSSLHFRAFPAVRAVL